MKKTKTRSLLVALAMAAAALSGAAQDNLRETQVVKVVKKVSPAVVYISCRQRVQNPFFSPFFEFFGEGEMPQERENSLGSGFLVDAKGYILTNEHVVMGGSDIKVTLSGGQTYPAKLMGTAPEADLALLKIEAKETLPTLELGHSDDLMIGEPVIAVGNPFGLSNTVSVGVLSATGRTINAGRRRFADFLQIDAPINPGNSGGPLLNIYGQVIGINTAIIRDAQNIGFAIPINRAKRVMEQLRAFGQVKPLWLGFLPLDLNEPAKRRLNLRGGVVVARTYPFAYPGVGEVLKDGDVLTSLNGKLLDGTADLNARLAMFSARQSLALEGQRDGKSFRASLEVAPLPDKLTPAMAWELLGLKVVAKGGGLVVDSVRRDSPAAETGIRAGDVVSAVESQPVESADDFLTRARVALGSTGLPIAVARGPWTYQVTLNLVGE